MKKINLTESQLVRIIKKVINETDIKNYGSITFYYDQAETKVAGESLVLMINQRGYTDFNVILTPDTPLDGSQILFFNCSRSEFTKQKDKQKVYSKYLEDYLKQRYCRH